LSCKQGKATARAAILRESKGGERDPSVLQRLALLELQITPDAG
jgi:hypothetical protein